MPGYHEYMKPEEVADLLRIKARTLYSPRWKSRIKHFYLGRSLRFLREDVEDFVERQREKGSLGGPRRPPHGEGGGGV